MGLKLLRETTKEDFLAKIPSKFIIFLLSWDDNIKNYYYEAGKAGGW